jgi:hypothetical protein
MITKVQFIKNKLRKKIKIKNRQKIKKNIERVQDKQQQTILN